MLLCASVDSTIGPAGVIEDPWDLREGPCYSGEML